MNHLCDCLDIETNRGFVAEGSSSTILGRSYEEIINCHINGSKLAENPFQHSSFTGGEILAESFSIDLNITTMPTIAVRVRASHWPVSLSLAAVLAVLTLVSVLLVAITATDCPRNLISPSLSHSVDGLANLAIYCGIE